MNLDASRRIVGSAAIASLVIGAALAAPSAALATRPAPDHKVTICHRTNSDTHPYVVETVDIASSGHLKGGHDTQHEGPIWDPTLKAQKLEWGDIIPPYTYGDFVYAGQNWSAEGEAMLRNDCAPSEPAGEPGPGAPSEEPTPEGAVEGETGRADPTPPPTDTVSAADRHAGDPSLLLVLLVAGAVIGGLGTDRVRARARR